PRDGQIAPPLHASQGLKIDSGLKCSLAPGFLAPTAASGLRLELSGRNFPTSKFVQIYPCFPSEESTKLLSREDLRLSQSQSQVIIERETVDSHDPQPFRRCTAAGKNGAGVLGGRNWMGSNPPV
ncbi:hypothetical protein THAOC_00392, partial [Thalassiosira oceanica]